MANEPVLVIGAGPAGIASAYALEKAGLRYKVIDKADVIASTWQQLYPSLRLNTTRFFSHLPEKRFPLSYGLFPTGRQYHRYLEAYTTERRFNIHLGIEVRRVSPENGLWRVETQHGVEHYPVVISATGVFGSPVWPHIPGLDDFPGLKLHAHDFRDPYRLTGKRVLVVGNGPSGVDISIAAAETSLRPVMISIRSGIDLAPRNVWGMPKHAWILLAEHLPEKWCAWLMRKIDQVRYALPDSSPLKPFAGKSGGSAIPYRGPELIDAVHDGRVIPVRAPLQFEGQSVTFTDGRVCEVDAVILATSYLPVLHTYLDIEMQFTDSAPAQGPCEWEIGPNGTRGWPLRDLSQHPNGRQILGHPGLYLVGVFYKGKGAMYNMNIEAEIAAGQIKDYLRAHFPDRA